MDEWKRGWRIVLGCALGAGTSASLFFFTFSLFILPLASEFGASRGDIAQLQSSVVVGILGAPLMGRMTDLFGFRRVFTGAILTVIAVEMWMALVLNSIAELYVSVALMGLIGIGTTSVTVSRPIASWFHKSRGLALGSAACGVAIATILIPPALEAIVAAYGWRSGCLALAVLAAFVGLPAVLVLVANDPPDSPQLPAISHNRKDWTFLGTAHFWMMAIALMGINMAGGGFVAQMSPVLQEEGLDSQAAAFALSIFACGQLIGRLAGGWCLDRFNPRIVAAALTGVPAAGFLLLWGPPGSVELVLLAVFLIGFQQGADIDIFAYFTARKYHLANFSTTYGMLQGLAFLGSAFGIFGFGQLHDAWGSYSAAQLISVFCLLSGALLIGSVQLPHHGAVKAI